MFSYWTDRKIESWWWQGDELFTVLLKNVSELLYYGALFCPSWHLQLNSDLWFCSFQVLNTISPLRLFFSSSWAKLLLLNLCDMSHLSSNPQAPLQFPLLPSITPTSTNLHFLPVLFIPSHRLVLRYKYHSCTRPCFNPESCSRKHWLPPPISQASFFPSLLTVL